MLTIWDTCELSVLSSQVFCQPKIVLKKKESSFKKETTRTNLVSVYAICNLLVPRLFPLSVRCKESRVKQI